MDLWDIRSDTMVGCGALGLAACLALCAYLKSQVRKTLRDWHVVSREEIGL